MSKPSSIMGTAWKRNRNRWSPSLHYPDWSALETDLLELIIAKLSFIDILRFKATCSSWHSIAESFLSSSSYNPLINPTVPWLMIPRDQQVDDPTTCSCFFNLAEEKVFKIKNKGCRDLLDDSWCVGSSHGWLVLLDKEADMLLFNPFTRAQLNLPSLDTFPFWSNFDPNFVKLKSGKSFIQKAILLSDPSRCNNFVVVVIYGPFFSLAFCRNGDSSWTELEGTDQYCYFDIICHNHFLYALTHDCSIQVWDFNIGSPIKNIEHSPSVKIIEARESYRDDRQFNKRCYLVESLGDLLLVVRLLNQQGKPVYETELLGTRSLVRHYRTLLFHVYKLDFEEGKWIEMKSLSDRVLFLGGNHSMSRSVRDFPECEDNSIYFTGDNMMQLMENYLYGGHDFGIFSLQEESVKSIFQCDLGKIKTPPLWVVPNPW